MFFKRVGAKRFRTVCTLSVLVIVLLGANGSGSGFPVCNVCDNQFDDPPPGWPWCEPYGYEPFCYGCQGWELDCVGGNCLDYPTYWQLTEFNGWQECGWMCPEDPPHCEPERLALDGSGDAAWGAEVDYRFGVEPGQPNAGVRAEETNGGVLFRRSCDDSVIGRWYAPDSRAKAVEQLASMGL